MSELKISSGICDLDEATRLLKEQERIFHELGNKDELATNLGKQANILHKQKLDELFKSATPSGVFGLQKLETLFDSGLVILDFGLESIFVKM